MTKMCGIRMIVGVGRLGGVPAVCIAAGVVSLSAGVATSGAATPPHNCHCSVLLSNGITVVHERYCPPGQGCTCLPIVTPGGTVIGVYAMCVSPPLDPE